MGIYLSLGSNSGNRRGQLRAALAELAAEGVDVARVSPVVESPALLPPDAPADWNAPFLNLVAECTTTLGPEALLERLKNIERRMGRNDPRHWAPRPIDIDILLFDDIVMHSERLVIPHPGLADRAFVLSPLAALAPGLGIPGSGETALGLSRKLGRTIPLWMGILNVTPDSFSDGGENASWPGIEASIRTMTASGVHILDFGAESTRPGATPLTPAEEWTRLREPLERALAMLGDDPLRPRFSVDTYHASVAAKALDLGVELINDVGGLGAPDMRRLAAERHCDFIAMHNLGLPADPATTLDPSMDTHVQIEQWLDRMIGQWLADGIDTNRVIFDPGIGFGKNPLQSLELMRDAARLGARGLRLLIGHSRKSFMNRFAGAETAERDLVTVGSSMALCGQGVEILRVHNVAAHIAAYRGWAHLQPAD